ncbi:MAG: NlpC/P60 family protein [Clostridiales bacterium]|nr:NlpC/P60 family protein [Clostridiales bacterium]
MTYKNKAVKTFFCAIIFSVCFLGAAYGINVSVGTVTASTELNLRSGPSITSPSLTTMPSGTKILVYSKNGPWLTATSAGKYGYLNSNYVKVTKNAEGNFGKGLITGKSVNVRADASTSSDILTTLEHGASVSIVGLKNNWYKVTANNVTGYVSSDYVTTATQMSVKKDKAASSKGSEIVDYAKQFLGVKYRHGGASPSGFDCSGFTYYVYKHFGITLSRASGAQYSSNCEKISKSELKTGDLVFFKNPNRSSKSIGHVGIYIGNNSFIHSSSPGDVVKITKLSDSYYVRNYKASGRVL